MHQNPLSLAVLWRKPVGPIETGSYSQWAQGVYLHSTVSFWSRQNYFLNEKKKKKKKDERKL